MNILFYYNKPINPIKGGIARITAFLGEYLEHNGHHVYYLAPKKEETLSFINGIQLYLDNADNSTTDRKNKFVKYLIDYNIEILIHQSATTPSQNHIVKWAKEYNIKVVSVFHSSLFGIYGINGRSHTNFIPKLLIKPLNKLVHFYFKIKYSSAYKDLISHSDKIVLLSDKFIDELIYFANFKEFNKVKAIPNPLTITPNINIEKKNIILSVGRLSASKQIDILLKVWSKIYNKYPDWSLEIIGDGEERNKLENISLKMKLKNIVFRGFQAPEEYYERAKIFSMTSAHEGFGLVLVEGMANGVVPIAFNSYPNIIDIIDDDNNGMLVTPFSIDEYVIKIEELIKNENKLSIMSENAIKKSESFSIEHIGKTWLVLISNL